MTNALMVIGMLLQVYQEAQKISTVLQKAISEGRDITEGELSDIKKEAISEREKLEEKLK
jgi:hypothetical protein